MIGTGDDDQSIYSWRKADPAGIRRFGSDYPGFDDYTLSVTLRCGKRIVEWANFVIQADPGRPADRACLDPLPGSPDGEVALLRFAGHVAEAKGVARLAAALVADGVAERDILILTRTDHNGTFSAPIKEALAEAGVACSDPGYVVEMLAELPNRELLEVLRLLVNPDDSVAWRATLHLLPRVGDTFCDYIYERAAAGGETFAARLRGLCDAGFPDGPSSSNQVTTRMTALLDWIGQTPIPDVRPDTGWGTWLLDLTDNADILPPPSQSFRELLVQLDSLTADEDSLSRFLALIEPLGKDLAQSISNGVRIMTMGGSKGLTAEAVIIAGCEDGVVPRPGSDLSEERRILYVGMTRARRHLLCTWAGRRKGPTARAGGATLERRRFCDFFSGGPVASEDGDRYIQNWTRG
ncbi:MAG: ATP-dependent helicase [Candidatus Bipolaricaulota bacterium]